MGTMSHRPFRELTKHFTPERRAYIEAGKAKIREEVAQEKAKRQGQRSAPARRDERLDRPLSVTR